MAEMTPETLRAMAEEMEKDWRHDVISMGGEEARAHADAWEQGLVDAKHEQFLADEQVMMGLKDRIETLERLLKACVIHLDKLRAEEDIEHGMRRLTY